MCQAIMLRDNTDVRVSWKGDTEVQLIYFFFLKNVQTLVQTLVQTPTCFFLTASVCDLQQ